MSSKVIIEEAIGERTFRLSAAQFHGVCQFVGRLADRGLVEMDRAEAEFMARALRAALDAMPHDGMEKPVPLNPQESPAPPPVQAKASEPPPRAGKRWEADEDNKLISQFRGRVDYRTIAKDFGRTPTAIIERLLFHKLVTVTPTEQAASVSP